MSRPLRRLAAAALVAGSFLAVAPQAQASLPQCQYYYIGRYVMRLCVPPVA